LIDFPDFLSTDFQDLSTICRPNFSVAMLVSRQPRRVLT
jgi:hypothetical protein